MQDIRIEDLSNLPVSRRQVEIVERKGVGHPDTICDALMEAASVALCAAYRQTAGRILHHNLDKGLLIAGRTTPAPGGGMVDAPMRIVYGDRATAEWQETKIPIGEIVEATTKRWIREHLRFVDPQKHLVLQNEIRPGSPELTDIFRRGKITANDTSAGVGYAPLSETERMVLAAERFLNSKEFKARHPETGEDVKVMAVRRDRILYLTVAVAFVDRFIADPVSYFSRKAEVEQELVQHLHPQLQELDGIELQLNTLDDPAAEWVGCI
jgi:S-adenosylmethionine synthetase